MNSYPIAVIKSAWRRIRRPSRRTIAKLVFSDEHQPEQDAVMNKFIVNDKIGLAITTNINEACE